MPDDYHLSIQVDSELKAQAEEVLSQFGMTMAGAFTMFLQQIVREQTVPLTCSLHSSNTTYTELLDAQMERANGYQGREAREVLADMEKAVAAAEAGA